jgi:FAD/FMN-containing dehydrogenase
MSKRKRWLAGVSVVALVAAGGAYLYAAPLMADPSGWKDCASVLPALPGDPAVAESPAGETLPVMRWQQRGGTINDASCLSRTAVEGIVNVASADDVARALEYARAKGLQVTPAGMKHSMGGHAFAPGNLVLDMKGLNHIELNAPASTVRVGSGATWHQIQEAIHPRFAVKAMQSTDIFTVGGSIAVNAHGMDHRFGALMDSIRSLSVMLADGSVVTASREENPELFRHVVGGYGLFGIVLEAELEVVPNAIYRSQRQVIATRDFAETFAALEADPSVGLTYTHLSTAPGSLLEDALVYSYRADEADAGLEPAPLGEVGSTRIRRLTINLSKRGDWFKSLKWWSEKNLEHRFETCTISRAQAQREGEACLVSRNDPMHDSVAYLYNDLPRETDILHEYFVPRANILPFVEEMRELFRARQTNLVNASIRAVGAEQNTLTYAPEPAFSVVLYITQPTDAAGNAAMARLTSDLIDLTATHGGRFFLPYQLNYTPEQLARHYPEIGDFFAAKRRWDPEERFTNTWYRRYAPAFAGQDGEAEG